MTCAPVSVRPGRIGVMVLGLMLAATAVFAQPTSARRIEIGGDLRWLAGIQVADANANETALGGATRTVFKSSTRFEAAAGADARVSVGLSSLIDGEASIAFGRTQLTTSITADPEAADATASEAVTEYLLEAGIAAHLQRWQRGRVAPLVSGGVGYLRQLHDGHTLVESGATYYAGGGVGYGPADKDVRGWKSVGIRVEVRATILRGPLTLDAGTRLQPAIIGGLFFRP